MNNLITRSLTGIVFVSVLVASLLLHEAVFVIVFLLIEIFALREFYLMAKKSELLPQKYYGSIVGAFVFLAAFAYNISDYGYYLALLIIPLLVFVMIFELYRNKQKPILNIATTIFGIVYVSLSFALTNFIVFFDGSFNGKILLGILILMWASDSGAYLFGVSFGKHRLFERISPKKSWEGFFGGLFLSLVVAYFMSKYFLFFSLTNWLVIACIIVFFGTLGDLVESLFKRSIEMKDSGKLLPGHGGILDRFDSILLAIPIIFTYLYFFF